MLPQDLVIEVRLRSFGRVGQVDVDNVKKGQFIKRFNAVGAWNLTLPNEDPMVANLKTPGSGLLVWLYDDVFLSGPMISYTKEEGRDDPLGTTTFVGADDMVVLADANAYPSPEVADPGNQVTASDDRSGRCEAVVKQYVDGNIGPRAPGGRRFGLTTFMRVEPDLGRGGQVAGSARFDVLGELIAGLCAVDGTLGFDVVQVDGEPATVFSMYTVEDRSGQVRMDVDNDMLDSTASGVAAPTTTVAIVAGPGDGVDRTFIAVTDTAAQEAQSLWGRRIERLIDARGSGDPEVIEQAGFEELAENGRTTVSLKVVPVDDLTMRFAKDWNVGDVVGVVVDDQPLRDVVSEAIVSLEPSGVKLGATVGDPVGYDWEATVTSQISDHESRLAVLERSQ